MMNSRKVRPIIASFAFVAGFVPAFPAMARDTPAEAANKQVVLNFYAALNEADKTHSTKARIKAIAEKYLSPNYHQNSDKYRNLPGSGSDRDKFIALFQNMPERAAPKDGMPPAPTTEAIMAEGDRVMMVTTRMVMPLAGGEPKKIYIFNMFSVKDGQLVEHWDGAS